MRSVIPHAAACPYRSSHTRHCAVYLVAFHAPPSFDFLQPDLDSYLLFVAPLASGRPPLPFFENQLYRFETLLLVFIIPMAYTPESSPD